MLDRLRALIKARRYRLTLHAEQERDADEITINEIEDAFYGPEAVIVEDYPDDSRGHSVLVLGFTQARDPAELVTGNLYHPMATFHPNLGRDRPLSSAFGLTAAGRLRLEHKACTPPSRVLK